jgi:hypothetical protein
MESLPVEILVSIADHLSVSGLVIFAFRLCKRFTIHLTSSRGVRSVLVRANDPKRVASYTRPIFVYFPKSLLYFQALEHLELISDDSVYDGTGMTELPWPKNLKTLRISKCALWIRPHQSSSPSSSIIHRVAAIKDILPSLTCLEMTGGLVGDWKPDALDKLVEMMPPSLQRLHLGMSSAKSYSFIPKEVKEIYHSGPAVDLDFLPLDVASSLRSLEWRLFPRSNIGEINLTRMTGLETLNLQVNNASLWPENWFFPLLTSLTLSFVTFTPDRMLLLPPTLSLLNVGWNDSVYGQTKSDTKIFDFLPSKLTSLSWSQKSAYVFDFTNFPRGLTKIDLNISGSTAAIDPKSPYIALPSGLEKLSLSAIKFESCLSHIQSIVPLPLVELSINIRNCQERDLYLLPRTLKKITFTDLPARLEEDHLAGLPPHLEELIIDFDKISRLNDSMPITFTDRIGIFLPKSLKVLKLPYALKFTGYSIPEDWDTIDDESVFQFFLNTMPPPLRNRTLTEMESLPHNDQLLTSKFDCLLPCGIILDLVELPKTVTSISILHCKICLDSLPMKHIRHLVLNDPITANYERGYFTNASLTQRLETLHMSISRKIQSLYFHLMAPANLVELCLPNVDLVQGKHWQPLPTNLKKLTLFSIDWKTIHSLLSKSNIIYLTLIDGTKLHSTHFNALPKTLTRLRLGSTACKKCSKKTIKHSLVSSDDILSESCISSLPPCLTQLEMPTVYGIRSSSLKIIPRSMKHLEVKYVDVSLDDFDMTGLKTLVLPEMIGQRYAEMVPKNLKLISDRWRITLQDSDSQALPSTLTELTILEHYSSITDHFIAALPQGLIKLEIPKQRGFSTRIIPLLPLCMSHITINAAALKPSFYENLPPSLTYIHLLGSSGWATKCSLKFLNKLNTLLIDEPSNLNDTFFAGLPSTITHLRIGDCASMTPNIVTSLPKDLTQLELYHLPKEFNANFPSTINLSIHLHRFKPRTTYEKPGVSPNLGVGRTEKK